MWKRRIIWLVLFLGALIFYLFENNGRTLAALLLCGLAPPVSFLCAYFRCRNASIQITAPERISCGTAADCMIRSSAEGNTTLYIENLHNSEEEQYPLTLKKGDNSFKLRTDCCGAVEFRIQGMEARDLFGLFSHKISREARQQVIVIPNLFPVEILMTESAHAMPDSDRYSSVKPGYDPSETFGMREYVPGDSIKAIHWKLSQKQYRFLYGMGGSAAGDFVGRRTGGCHRRTDGLSGMEAERKSVQRRRLFPRRDGISG